MTIPDAQVAAIAASLTERRREALALLPIWGFPAGHNQWPDVEYVSPVDQDVSVCSGEDMDFIIRCGLAVAGKRDEDGGIHLIDDDRECEARWPIDITPLGEAVRAHIQEIGS